MKLPVMAAAAMAAGIVGGALVSGLGAKSEIMEARAQAEADSLAALEHPTGAEGHEGVTVELPEEERPEAPDSLDHAPQGPGEPGQVVEALPEETPESASPEEPQPAEAQGEGIEGVTGVANPASLPLNAPDSAIVPSPQAVEEGAPATTPPQAPVSDEGSRKLAKIFGAMDPDDAANVLREMTDEEVTAILVRMSDRVAAPIIAAFPAERAATLGQAVIRATSGGS